jgi:hypothetical protein
MPFDAETDTPRPDAGPVHPGITSLYLPTAAACAEAVAGAAGQPPGVTRRRIEVPQEFYEAVVALLSGALPAAAPDPGGQPAVPVGPAPPLSRGTLTYAQASTLARSGRLAGVAVDAETGRVTTDCSYGLGFAAGYARACWAGAEGDQAIAQALAWHLEAESAVGALIAERLRGNSKKAAAIGNAASGIAQSPVGRSTVGAALGAAKSLTGSAGTAIVGAPMRANPLVSTLTAVVNLDLYRAALARSISWRQFTKNLVVKTSGSVTAVGGWFTGAAAGSMVGGPVGALIGGLLGAAGGAGAGSAAAKRVADRLVPDDAERMLALVREVSEALALEHLLVDAELDHFAAALKERVNPVWLRRLYQAGRRDGEGTWNREQARAFAEAELRALCGRIAAARPRILLPAPARVEEVLARAAQVADALEGDAGAG